jgi:ADP-ribose pyrophosphatase YjhB (NUDIX family)
MYPDPKFCSACGSPVTQEIPAEDSRLRHVCKNCNAVHYINPKMVLGTIPVFGDQIMLCRRAIEPRHGFWTLPAGFMEINESVHQGAARETLEEAGARVRLGPPFTIFDVQRAQQVHMFFRAELLDLDYAAGPESLEVRMFREEEIPWDDLAFLTVSKTLKLFFEDRKAGQFRLHSGDLYDAVSWPADAFRHNGD